MAAIKDGDLIEAELERLQLPALEQSKRLAIFVEDTARELKALNASGLAVLKAEQTPPGANRNISHVYDRAVLETLIRLSGITAGLPVELISRRTARSRLKLPIDGKLDDYLDKVFPTTSGKYWKAGRALAAVAALALERA